MLYVWGVELVQRGTGHKTTAVVLKHYFRPKRQDFKRRILEAAPQLLAGMGTNTIDIEAHPSSHEAKADLRNTDKGPWLPWARLPGYFGGCDGKG